MNSLELLDNLDLCIRSKVVPFIQGAPGVGKSAVVKALADKYKLKLIDIRLAQCDVTDLNGFPKLDGTKATYLPMDTFPIETDSIPDGYSGWLIFLDELNSANKSLQACAYKIILDRMVGQHKLHKNVSIICAGNREEDNAVVNQLSTALKSRMVSIQLDIDYKSWLTWAEATNIDFRVTAYINFKGDEGLFDFDPERVNNAYCCPRTWEMVSKIIKKVNDLDKYRELLIGTIGNQAHLFIEYANNASKLPSIDTIMKGLAVGENYNNGENFMIVSNVLANATKITNNTEAKNVVKFLDELGKEYAVIFYSSCYKKNPALMNMESVSKKMLEYASYLRA